MNRITRAFLKGPMIVVPIIFATTFLLGIISGEFKIIAIFFTSLAMSVFAVPISYAGTAVFGIPLYLYLKKRNKFHLSIILPYAAIVGGSTGLLMESLIGGLYFAFCAVSVAYMIWIIGIDE